MASDFHHLFLRFIFEVVYYKELVFVVYSSLVFVVAVYLIITTYFDILQTRPIADSFSTLIFAFSLSYLFAFILLKG